MPQDLIALQLGVSYATLAMLTERLLRPDMKTTIHQHHTTCISQLHTGVQQTYHRGLSCTIRNYYFQSNPQVAGSIPTRNLLTSHHRGHSEESWQPCSLNIELQDLLDNGRSRGWTGGLEIPLEIRAMLGATSVHLHYGLK